VVGPAAARGHGVDTSGLPLSPELDLIPAPTDDNLANLARALSAASAKLRADGGLALSITLSPDLFRAIPALPLTTEAGACNVLLHPVGALADYEKLLGDATTIELDNVPTLVATIDALLDGLAGGARQPHPELIARLSRQGARTTSNEPVTALLTSPLEAERHDDLEQAILWTVEHLGHPASIRDLLFAMNAERRAPYKRIKRAAEALAAHGLLLRDKDGTAYRYRLNTDSDDQLAHQVATLLARSADLEATLARALNLATPNPLAHPVAARPPRSRPDS
jgi:predicted transcriptional regulator